MENKKISKQDYEHLESFSAAVNDVQYTLSILNHHLEILKRTGDIDSLNYSNKSMRVVIGDIITKYKKTLSNESNEQK